MRGGQAERLGDRPDHLLLPAEHTFDALPTRCVLSKLPRPHKRSAARTRWSTTAH